MVPFEKQMLSQGKGSAGNMLLVRRCNSNIKKIYCTICHKMILSQILVNFDSSVFTNI